jgi:hypothetical protein
MQYLSQSAAAHFVDPQSPLSADTLRIWHDKVGGPRDSTGRRIWTLTVCEQIRAARVAVRKARSA